MNQDQNSQKLFDRNEFDALKDFVKTAEQSGDIKKVPPIEASNQPNSFESKVKQFEGNPDVKSESNPSSIKPKEQSTSQQAQPYVPSPLSTITGKEDYLSDSMKQKIDQDERDILCRFDSAERDEIFNANSSNTSNPTPIPNPNPNPQVSKISETITDNKIESTKVVKTNSQPQQQQLPQEQIVYSNDQKDWDGNIKFGNIQDRMKMFEPKNNNQIKTAFPPKK